MSSFLNHKNVKLLNSPFKEGKVVLGGCAPKQEKYFCNLRNLILVLFKGNYKDLEDG